MPYYNFFKSRIYIPKKNLLIQHPVTKQEYKTEYFIRDLEYTIKKLNIKLTYVHKTYILYRLGIKKKCNIKYIPSDMVQRITASLMSDLSIDNEEIIKKSFLKENQNYMKIVEETYDMIISKLEKYKLHENEIKYPYKKIHYIKEILHKYIEETTQYVIDYISKELDNDINNYTEEKIINILKQKKLACYNGYKNIILEKICEFGKFTILNEDHECSVCLDFFPAKTENTLIKLGNCTHIICIKCFNNIKNDKIMKCPFCGTNCLSHIVKTISDKIVNNIMNQFRILEPELDKILNELNQYCENKPSDDYIIETLKKINIKYNAFTEQVIFINEKELINMEIDLDDFDSSVLFKAFCRLGWVST
jgi:hypothetical protein